MKKMFLASILLLLTSPAFADALSYDCKANLQIDEEPHNVPDSQTQFSISVEAPKQNPGSNVTTVPVVFGTSGIQGQLVASVQTFSSDGRAILSLAFTTNDKSAYAGAMVDQDYAFLFAKINATQRANINCLPKLIYNCSVLGPSDLYFQGLNQNP